MSMVRNVLIKLTQLLALSSFCFFALRLQAVAATVDNRQSLASGQTSIDGKLTFSVIKLVNGSLGISLRNNVSKKIRVDFYALEPGELNRCNGQNVVLKAFETRQLCVVGFAHPLPMASPSGLPNVDPNGGHASIQLSLSWQVITPIASPAPMPSATYAQPTDAPRAKR